MTWAIFSAAHQSAIKEIMQSDSDRIVAIVGGAILDDTLDRNLSERFRDHKDTTRKLLKVNGPLGNTGPKIDLLYQLHAFEKPVRDALSGLSDARNFLAHNLEASLDSTDEKMVNAMEKLILHEERTHYSLRRNRLT